MLFPINIADFLFKDGLQVISAHEVLKMTETNEQVGPDLMTTPYLSNYGSKDNDGNEIRKETMLTS